MTLNQNINSDSLQQFQKLWNRISSLNKIIMMVNKKIEIVKSHISELIGIDVSNLGTPDDLSNYVTKDELPDLSDFATKDEIPDLSNYVSKTEMYYERDPTKDLRIKYNTSLTTSSITKIIFTLGEVIMVQLILMIIKIL
jgi:hypothetical protein